MAAGKQAEAKGDGRGRRRRRRKKKKKKRGGSVGVWRRGRGVKRFACEFRIRMSEVGWHAGFRRSKESVAKEETRKRKKKRR